MSCALPIIGARTGGIPGIVSEENGILVEPTDVEKIKKAILKMMHQPELRKEMGQMNRQKMIEKYSWRHVADMYLNIYYRSVNQKTVFQDVTTMALPEAQDLDKSSTPEVYDDMRL
jgi:spore coat protein SA